MLKTYSIILFLIPFFLVSYFSLAQDGSVKGTVTDDETGEPLIGVTVIEKGTNNGTVTDIDGSFSFNVSGALAIVQISYVGYKTIEKTVGSDFSNLRMETASVGLEEVEIVANVAVDRKTPVAVSTLKGKMIAEKLGNQEFPQILRFTPSIYATRQGGGFGDSRVNVRGFSQVNTAVLINGIPVNDMENGSVYWSNWAGIAEVTSNMQVQRGMGASKLAVPSVGGTINIITKASDFKKGGKVKFTVGNNGYLKESITYHTGLSDKKFALSMSLSSTSGNGYINKTKFHSVSYFLTLAKIFNKKHSIAFTMFGAPQWHNQRRIGRYDKVYVDTTRTATTPVNLKAFDRLGERYNPVGGTLNGDEFSWRTNFYHKPKLILNHYWHISPKTELSTSFYVSLGRGGGTGPRGSINESFDSDAKFKDNEGNVRFDEITDWNRGDSVQDFGQKRTNWAAKDNYHNRDSSFVSKNVNTSRNGFIRRSSINSHNWVGLLANLRTELTNDLMLTVGLDLRRYRGLHYRRLNSLLGADAYFTRADRNKVGEFITEQNSVGVISSKFSDDRKLNYNNDGVVNWQGVFGQLEYAKNKVSAFVSLSASNQGFRRIDYFNLLDGDDTEDDGTPKQTTDFKNIFGGNVKAGINYNFNARINGFFNIGYISRQPFFDAVYPNNRNNLNTTNLQNEKIFSVEFGWGYRTSKLALNLNLYRTSWGNRFDSRSTEFTVAEVQQDGNLNLNGLEQLHQGIEIDGVYKPVKKLSIEYMVSVGDWRYANNIVGVGALGDGTIVDRPTVLLKDKKVGDAAQTTARLGATYEFIKGLRLYASYYHVDDLYADISVFDENDKLDPVFQSETLQPVKLPSYGLVDLGLYYDLGLKSNKMLSFALNTNNALDKKYVAELDTNIQGSDKDFKDNRGFYGFGRTWTLAMTFKF